jgi:hypothetical protein
MKRTSRGSRFVRTGCGPDRDAEFVGDDIGERRLSESRGPAQQRVVHRLPALLRGGEKDLHLPDHLFLPDVLGKACGPEGPLDLDFLREGFRLEGSFVHPVHDLERYFNVSFKILSKGWALERSTCATAASACGLL